MKTDRVPSDRSDAIEPRAFLSALYSIDGPACRQYLGETNDVLDAAEIGFIYQVTSFGGNRVEHLLPYWPRVPIGTFLGRFRV